MVGRNYLLPNGESLEVIIELVLLGNVKKKPEECRPKSWRSFVIFHFLTVIKKLPLENCLKYVYSRNGASFSSSHHLVVGCGVLWSDFPSLNLSTWPRHCVPHSLLAGSHASFGGEPTHVSLHGVPFSLALCLRRRVKLRLCFVPGTLHTLADFAVNTRKISARNGPRSLCYPDRFLGRKLCFLGELFWVRSLRPCFWDLAPL